MSDLSTYLAVFSYPAIVILVFDWWGEESRWASKNKSFRPPPDLLTRAERKGRFLFFLKYGLLLLLLYVLAGKDLWYFILIRGTFRSQLILIGMGLVSGILVFSSRRLLVLVSSVIAATEANDCLLRGPVALWLMIFVAGAISEEWWRALCISALRQNGYSAIAADLLPAISFAIAHLGGLPARISGGLKNVGPEMVIGLMLGFLFIRSGTIVPGTLASIIYYSLNLFWLRRHFGRSILASSFGAKE